jgi:hypothetical protein
MKKKTLKKGGYNHLKKKTYSVRNKLNSNSKSKLNIKSTLNSKSIPNVKLILNPSQSDSSYKI